MPPRAGGCAKIGGARKKIPQECTGRGFAGPLHENI